MKRRFHIKYPINKNRRNYIKQNNNLKLWKQGMLIFFLLPLLLCGLNSCNPAEPEPPPPKPPGYQEDIPWPSLADSPWPIFGADPQNTKRASGYGPTNGINEGALNNYMSNSGISLGEDGTLYFISTDKNGLVALSTDGNEKWVYLFDKRLPEYPASPLLGSDGTIYCSSPGDSAFHAINTDGTLRWQINNLLVATSGINIGPDGIIYVLAKIGRHTLVAITTNGEILWQIDNLSVNSGEGSSFSFSPDGEKLYFSGQTNTLTAIDAQTGDIEWVVNMQYGISTPSVDYFGNIFVLLLHDDKLSLAKFNPSGELLWKYTTEEEWLEGLSIDKYGNCIFGFESIYSISYKGELNWKYELEEGILNMSPTTDNNCDIFLAITLMDNSTEIIKLNKLGELLFSLNIPALLKLGGWHTFLGYNFLYLLTSSGKILKIN